MWLVDIVLILNIIYIYLVNGCIIFRINLELTKKNPKLYKNKVIREKD